MPRGKVLSDEEKVKILAYEDKGLKYAQISRKIGRSRCVIRSFLKNKDKYGKKYKTGRKPKLSDPDKRIIINKATNEFISCAQLADQCHKRVSKMTVWRVLNSSEIIKRSVMKKVPTLHPHHKTARLQFASNNLDTAWDSFIFTDEKKFNLVGPDGSQCYWRDLRKEPLSKRNFGGGSGMAWGAIQFVTSQINSTNYIEVLERSLLPFLEENRERSHIFMQDNAAIHTVRHIKDFLEKYIPLRLWAAQLAYLTLVPARTSREY